MRLRWGEVNTYRLNENKTSTLPLNIFIYRIHILLFSSEGVMYIDRQQSRYYNHGMVAFRVRERSHI